jgi:transcriptional regulator with XRE-family HTH domain
MKTISDIVKAQRVSLGLTLEELGKKAELSQGFLSRVEKGDYDAMNMSLDTIIRLAGALKLKVKDFLDNLQLTEPAATPELSVYLRQKYNINDSQDVKMIENIISKFSGDEEQKDELP